MEGRAKSICAKAAQEMSSLRQGVSLPSTKATKRVVSAMDAVSLRVVASPSSTTEKRKTSAYAMSAH
jgi:hypothetical protein